MGVRVRSQQILGGTVKILLASGVALGLILASGLLDAELGARQEPVGIRCCEGGGAGAHGCWWVCLLLCNSFVRRLRTLLAQMHPDAASETNSVPGSVYLIRPSPRGCLLLALAIFLVQVLPSPCILNAPHH